MGFYAESVDRPHVSRVVSSDIYVGEIGAHDGSDKAEPFDFNNHDETDLLGVADNHRSGNRVVKDIDDTGGFTFQASEDDRASFIGDEDRAVIKVRTAEDTGGNEPTPDVESDDVVGIVDTSAGALSSTSEYQGRIVEEGYSDDGTTFNRSNNNFFAIGVVRRDSANAWDAVVRVQVRKDLN